MTCMRFDNGDVVCVGGPGYLFQGYFFEVHRYIGPWPLNKLTHDPCINIPAGFWEMWSRFEQLSATERAVYAVH